MPSLQCALSRRAKSRIDLGIRIEFLPGVHKLRYKLFEVALRPSLAEGPRSADLEDVQVHVPGDVVVTHFEILIQRQDIFRKQMRDNELVVVEGIDGNKGFQLGANLIRVRQCSQQAVEFLLQMVHDSSKKGWLG